MPTYEYRCPECGTDFEKFQRMSDEPVAECPKCGAAAQRRLSGGAGLLFKGSGFYITDYRGEGYKKAAKSESGGSEPGESSAGKPSDSKSDSKSDPKSASSSSSSTSKQAE
jgi:putative FmdB family regulatory protein